MEVKKLLHEKLFLVFVFLCLCLNIGLCFCTPDVRSEVNRIAENGISTQGEKIYDTLDSEVLGSYYYNERYINSSLLAQQMKNKYEALQESIDLLDGQNADLSSFAGEITALVHQALFAYQLKALLLECIVFISLLGLRAYFIEKQMETDALIYSTRRGRKIARDKLFATGAISFLYCFILIVISLGIFFSAWNFGDLWNSNIASSFNYVIDSSDPILWKPFITWASLSLREYFTGSLILMIGIIVAWWLLTNLIVFLVRSAGAGMLILTAILLLPFFGLTLLPKLHLAWLYFFDTLTLSTVVYCNQWWFTDLGNYSLFAYQEVWIVIIHLVMGLFGIWVVLRYFERKKELA
jgi:hypothetical protein